MQRKYKKLSVIHPKATWLACFVVIGFAGMVLGLMNLTVSESGAIIFNTSSTICFAVYGSSCFLFLYVRLTPKYKNCRAGDKNIGRLKCLIENYPEIAIELGAEKYCRSDISFKELKILARQANRLIILLSANDLVGTVKGILPKRNKQ